MDFGKLLLAANRVILIVGGVVGLVLVALQGVLGQSLQRGVIFLGSFAACAQI